MPAEGLSMKSLGPHLSSEFDTSKPAPKVPTRNQDKDRLHSGANPEQRRLMLKCGERTLTSACTHLAERSLGMNEGTEGENAEAAPMSASTTIFFSMISGPGCAGTRVSCHRSIGRGLHAIDA